MSESRDNDDKEGKRKKKSDVQQEEQVSKEGSASSSTPLVETATQTEGSGEGNVHLPFHKLTTHYDHHDAISQSKSGAAINRRDDFPLSNIAILGEFKRMGQFLFELQLTCRDVECGKLTIPVKTASSHFPSTTLTSNFEYPIVISDAQNDIWYMKLTYYKDPQGVMLWYI